MRYDFSPPLLELNGKAILENGAPVTYRGVAVQALMSDRHDDAPDKKLYRFQLAMKISDAAAVVDLTPDEMSFLRGRIREMCGALVVGRFEQVFDPPIQSLPVAAAEDVAEATLDEGPKGFSR